MLNKKKKYLTTAAAASLAAAVVVGGGTFAYLKGQTDEVVNTFDVNQVTVEISETDADYEIIPGTKQSKDPSLTIDNTLTSFLFVKVTDNTKLSENKSLVSYKIANGWNLLKTETKTDDDGNEYIESVYYRLVEPTFYDDGNVKKQTFNILNENEVSYSAALVNEDMLDKDGKLRKDVALSFQGTAIQARPFTDASADGTVPTEFEAAEKAYYELEDHSIHVKTFNGTEDGLRTIMKTIKANETQTITLDNDIELSLNDVKNAYTIDVKGNVTINLNGYKIYTNEIPSGNGSGNMFNLWEGSSLTIKGDGGIDLGDYYNTSAAFNLKGGKLTIVDGTYRVCGRFISVASTANEIPSVVINSGTFSQTTPYGGWHMFTSKNGDEYIRVYGGAFAEYKATQNVSMSPNPLNPVRYTYNSESHDFVADGYDVKTFTDETGKTYYEVYKTE